MVLITESKDLIHFQMYKLGNLQIVSSGTSIKVVTTLSRPIKESNSTTKKGPGRLQVNGMS